MKVSFAFALIVFGSIALNANGQVAIPYGGSQLLMGTLVRQGPSKHDVLQGQKGVEEVKVKTFIRS
jgi:hypothetical protein